MKKFKFNDDWVKREVLDIDRLRTEKKISAGNIFVLHILIAGLNFINEKKVKTYKDYNKFKEELIKNENSNLHKSK